MTRLSGFKSGIVAILGIFGTAASAEPIQIVTDLPAVASLASQILGSENGSVVSLLEQGDDVHHFSLRPSQALQLADADLVAWISPDLTPWLGKAAAALADDVNADPLEGEEEAHDHNHEEGDPHLWLDPQEISHWAEEIAMRVASVRPELSDEVAQNLTIVKRDMVMLEQEIIQILKPLQGVGLVSMHDAFGIFAERFDISILGNLTVHDDAAPSARQLYDMRQIIETKKPGCLLAGVGTADQLIGTVTEGFEIDVTQVDIIGRNGGPDAYRAMMIQFATQIADCVTARS